MEILSQDEKVELLARYAVVMHLEANRKVGRIAKVIIIVAILISIYARIYWPLAIAAALCLAVYLYVIFSCLNFVERKTGMPHDMQAFYSRLYKSDAQFAKEVDEQHESSLNIASYLNESKGHGSS